jgi:sugar lactone lactonase YvrE
LLWVDSLGQTIRRLDFATGERRDWHLPEPVGSVGLRKHGGLVLALRSGLYLFSTETSTLEFLLNVEPDFPLNRLNDSRVDAWGNYWVGSHCDSRMLPTASLYRYSPSGDLRRMDTGFLIPNGIAFSPDGYRLYCADTPRRQVYVYDHDPETGAVAGRRVFVDFEGLDGRPDGAAVDVDGNYWSAAVRGGKILCFSSRGRLLHQVDLPVEHPTMCAFGGARLDVLYVTSTRHLSHSEDTGLAGKTFAIHGLGATGQSACLFHG